MINLLPSMMLILLMPHCSYNPVHAAVPVTDAASTATPISAAAATAAESAAAAAAAAVVAAAAAAAAAVAAAAAAAGHVLHAPCQAAPAVQTGSRCCSCSHAQRPCLIGAVQGSQGSFAVHSTLDPPQHPCTAHSISHMGGELRSAFALAFCLVLYFSHQVGSPPTHGW